MGVTEGVIYLAVYLGPPAVRVVAVSDYRPDKVSHLADEFKVIAEQKAKEINDNYQTLFDWLQNRKEE